MIGVWVPFFSFHVYTEGEIVIWADEAHEVVISAWLGRGSISIPFVEGCPFVEVLEDCKIAIANNEWWCITCGDVIDEETQGGSHMAGRYCKSCWEKYMRDHPSKCLKCGAPRWKCVC